MPASLVVAAALTGAVLGWPNIAVAGARGAPVASSGFGSNWTTYHGDAEATGVDAASTKLTPSRPAWTSPALDGHLYGKPLVADGRVVAATENDTVYVMAANSGTVLWSRHLATPVPSHDLPCGDISPEVGITGTPVIDLTRHEIFVDADTLISGPAGSDGVEASHGLFGLDLFTGNVELDEPAMPNTGEDQLAQLQRPGLALDKGYVVIAYGQNSGDCPGPNGPAHGYVVSIPEAGGQLHSFRPVAAEIAVLCGWAGALRSSTPTAISTWRALTATTSVPARRMTTATQCSSCRRACTLNRSFTPKTGRC